MESDLMPLRGEDPMYMDASIRGQDIAYKDVVTKLR